MLPGDPHSNVEITRNSIRKLGCLLYQSQLLQMGHLSQRKVRAGIGDISIVAIDENDSSCEIGYVLGKAYWGHGIMTEALKAVLDFVLLKQVFKKSRHVMSVSIQLQVVSWRRLECPILKTITNGVDRKGYLWWTLFIIR